ncbi:hypothetical protein LQW54_012376 [Pestalotiopsis sp. IQ-011]
MAIVRDNSLLSDPSLLEKIDKLRDFNIGQHVPLPQLVVVGDQSSGKSSLLESLTGVPFPKDQSLCTRHATQITSRRSDQDYVQIRIIAGPHASEDHKKEVSGFCVKLNSSLEFRNQFVEILKKANEKMGLRVDLKTGVGAVFSEDVLKIEIHGPSEDYLTIIDVPGIFRTTTEGTTKDDMLMVRDLVKRYVRDSRTIILAVLPANVDIATQEILELAEDYDKHGERTIAVLTKPDLVIEPSAQAAVCELVKGNRRPLTLGYFLVRNRGGESNAVVPPALDDMFRLDPWNDLPRDRVGIAALKSVLAVLLMEITRREFPRLIRDIGERTRECKKELDSLGPTRQDEREQRSFLSQVAGAFQDRARAALAADYNADEAFAQDELRLITHMVNITDVFSADFQQEAHSRYFEGALPPRSGTPEDDEDLDSNKTQADRMMEKLRLLLEEASVDDPTEDEIAELSEVLKASPSGDNTPRHSLSDWIGEAYIHARGLDLGTFNVNFVSYAFSEQSRKWGCMTRAYMSRCIIMLHRFIAGALRAVLPDDLARAKLWAAIVESLVEKYKLAIEQAEVLIEVERRKKPYTLMPQFNKALSRARGKRVADLLRPKARKDTQYGSLQHMVNLDDIAEAREGKRNAEQLQEDIHDILEAYYNLALDRFIDNVFQLAVDYQLLHGPSSPLNVFNQDWVINLSPEQLERIVGEAKSAKAQRSRLMKKISDLAKAIDILKA